MILPVLVGNKSVQRFDFDHSQCSSSSPVIIIISLWGMVWPVKSGYFATAKILGKLRALRGGKKNTFPLQKIWDQFLTRRWLYSLTIARRTAISPLDTQKGKTQLMRQTTHHWSRRHQCRPRWCRPHWAMANYYWFNSLPTCPLPRARCMHSSRRKVSMTLEES